MIGSNDADGLDEDAEEDFPPPPPPRLARAGEQLLKQATEVRDRGPDDRVRLVRVFERIGGLSAFCLERAGLFASTFDPQPLTNEDRADEAERVGDFIRACADELARIASLAVQFSVALTRSLAPDWEDKAEAINDIRSDLMNELAVLAGRSPNPLAPTKRDIADEVDRTLRTGALNIAQAAHELRDARLPGHASVTMVDLAAQLLHAGMTIADAAGYQGWPALEGDYDW